MDWYLDACDGAAVKRLGRELGAYLRRYGAGDSDYAAAGLAFDELVGNVAAHAGGRAWVRLDWSDEIARLEVRDEGPGFALPAAPRRGSGLDDVIRLAGPVEVSREEAGARVTLELPVRRRSRPGPGPQRPRADALPAPAEAAGDGTFGKESFLRALVVQLALEVEREHGPEAAEDAIAQVGSDVGGRMEDEYRRAHGIVERLRPEEIGDLYVRLKHAIDGDFRVLEATDERIVLANRRCPFGDAVRRAPGLCRMTSSVFGGIAARNGGAATVQLERRIAVGDPECRVTVWLGEQARGDRFGHRYRSAVEVSAPEPERVVLAEDYAYLRDPLIDALADASIEVVSHANTPATLLLKVEKYRPDVAIIDFREADTDKGIAVAAEIRERFPGVAVLVLAEHVEVASARELLGRNAHGVGYLLKDGLAREEFVAAVRRVAAGAAALDPAIVPELVGGSDPLDDLSPRELEVLELLAAGLSNQAIADRLVITKRAVEKHVKGIFRKLRLVAANGHDRRVLAALAYSKSR